MDDGWLCPGSCEMIEALLSAIAALVVPEIAVPVAEELVKMMLAMLRANISKCTGMPPAIIEGITVQIVILARSPAYRLPLFFLILSGWEKIQSTEVKESFILILTKMEIWQYSIIVELWRPELFSLFYCEEVLRQFYAPILARIESENVASESEIAFAQFYQTYLAQLFEAYLANPIESYGNVPELVDMMAQLLIARVETFVVHLSRVFSEEQFILQLYRRFLLCLQPVVTHHQCATILLTGIHGLLTSFSVLYSKVRDLTPFFLQIFVETFDTTLTCLMAIFTPSAGLELSAKFSSLARVLTSAEWNSGDLEQPLLSLIQMKFAHFGSPDF
jgi:hypothetical protein